MYKIKAKIVDDDGLEISPSMVEKRIGNDRVLFFPTDDNPEAREYKEWLDEGNTPEPADE